MLLLLSRSFPLGSGFLRLRRMGESLLPDLVCCLGNVLQTVECLLEPLCRAISAVEGTSHGVDLPPLLIEQSEKVRHDAVPTDDGTIAGELLHKPCVGRQPCRPASFHEPVVFFGTHADAGPMCLFVHKPPPDRFRQCCRERFSVFSDTPSLPLPKKQHGE